METCTKKIKHSERNVGILYTTVCGKPSHVIDGKSQGLCHGHYNKAQKKLANWIDRKEYRQVTEEDLLNRRSLKLSNSHVHKLYQVKDGVVYEWYDGKYNQPTDFLLDPSLFCVKI